MNPLFTDDTDDKKKQTTAQSAYVLPNRHGRKIQPIHTDITREPDNLSTAKHLKQQLDNTPKQPENGSNPAVNLIRRKLENLYVDEPSARQEIRTIKAAPAGEPLSKHQDFMRQLSASGKSLAQIQTAWHHYYAQLSDHQKHEVWQEFYSHNNRQQSPYTQYAAAHATAQTAQPHPHAVAHVQQPMPQVPFPSHPHSYRPVHHGQHTAYQHHQAPVSASHPHAVVSEHAIPEPAHQARSKRASVQALKKKIVQHANISARQQAKAKQHLKSLFFGLLSGAAVLLIVLFGLFNEMVIAPFIRPNQNASATPIILSTDGIAPSATPEVIIPKINVQIPVDYTLTNNTEEAVQAGLEKGVVHYPTTVKPGEKGNAAFFGHSSNNIFNPGKYKFAFVLLNELVPGDIFYLTYEGKVYTYKVYDKQIVKPSQVEILNSVPGKTATAALITCDPPGTTLNRLVVWGEQVNPNPDTAAEPAAPVNVTPPTEITGNGPSLWQRLTGWITGNNSDSSE